MKKEAYLNQPPYSISQAEKKSQFQLYMKSLTEHHRNACKAYDDICNGLENMNVRIASDENGPFLPVALFKDLELASVPEEKIIKKVTSSGTTGQQVSKIYLDAETSAAQQRALCMITGDYIGGDRIPMLIIDSPDVLRDRKKFSARGAGILGFSMMASKRYYALTPEMKIDWDSLNEFCARAAEGPTFAFGFTYMIWAYFYQALHKAGYGHCVDGQEIGSNSKRLNLGSCYLIHGGGWKKLQNQKVSDEKFKAGLLNVCGISKVADYYGMAEQTGSIFMECPRGHLHASIYSDITVLNPEDFSERQTGEWGLLALQSLLPESYPGHKLLTEDWGRILGEDDCPCGRKGKYFEIQGRISKAEIRGCSDTFEGKSDTAVEGKSNYSQPDDEAFEILAGAYPPSKVPLEAFDSLVLDYIDELSHLFTKDKVYRNNPEIYSLGFWCRKSHIEQIKTRQSCNTNLGYHGRGLVLHVTPSNMPTMFTYSFITSLLAGNANIVRLSQRESEISNLILKGIREILDKPKYAKLKERNAFVRFPHGHQVLERISMEASARIIWGGDATVKAISEIPKKNECIDIAFPDKYSIGLIDAKDILDADQNEIKRMAHLFYNDTFGADQNACSSPKTIFWVNSQLKNAEDIQARKEEINAAKTIWWNAVSNEAQNYKLQPWMATEKYRTICKVYACNGEGTDASSAIGEAQLQPAKFWGNRLYVVPCSKVPQRLEGLEAKMGIFYEYDLNSIDEIFPYMNEKIQTVVCSGSNQEKIWQAVRSAGCSGVDRVVHFGEALNFDTVWDRKDIIGILSE